MGQQVERECRECDGTGEGCSGRRCGGCGGRGVRVVPVEHDGSLCVMEAELDAVDPADVPAMPTEQTWHPPCALCGVSARQQWLDGQREAERRADYEVTVLAEGWRARQGGEGSWGHRLAVLAATSEASASAAREVRS